MKRKLLGVCVGIAIFNCGASDLAVFPQSGLAVLFRNEALRRAQEIEKIVRELQALGDQPPVSSGHTVQEELPRAAGQKETLAEEKKEQGTPLVSTLKKITRDGFKDLVTCRARLLVIEEGGKSRGRISNRYLDQAEEKLRGEGYVPSEEDDMSLQTQGTAYESQVRRTKTKRKECKECDRKFLPRAFFNHSRRHLAVRLQEEAGADASHRSYYYEEAKEILKKRKGDQ